MGYRFGISKSNATFHRPLNSALLLFSCNFSGTSLVILFGAFMKQLYYFFADAALIALRSIFAQKMRAFLTLIGIIIVVSSVVVVGITS